MLDYTAKLRMPTTVEDVTAKAEMLEIEPKSGVDLKPTVVDHKDNEAEPKIELNGDGSVEKKGEENKKNKAKVDEVPVPDEVETKTGISFPGKLDDGKLLKAVGLRKKSMLGMGIKIYAFGNLLLLHLPTQYALNVLHILNHIYYVVPRILEHA